MTLRHGLITTHLDSFRDYFWSIEPQFDQATMREALLISPDNFYLSKQSALDNVYMDFSEKVDLSFAEQQYRGLMQSLEIHGVPVQVFVGKPQCPDAVFPNNVFATSDKSLIIGSMYHPDRQREAERDDIPEYFKGRGYQIVDLRGDGAVCELTGSIIIDHARKVGFAGRSNRLNDMGIEKAHEAFGLNATLVFDLPHREYHTNIVMSILGGKAAVFAPNSFVTPEIPHFLEELYPDHCVPLSIDEKNQFAGNCLAIGPHKVMMSATSFVHLEYGTKEAFQKAGFSVIPIEVSEFEKAGGSLRCLICEVF